MFKLLCLCAESHISKHIDEISTLCVSRIPYSAKDLKDNNTKAEDVGFNREDALRSILRGHVSTKIVCDIQVIEYGQMVI
jgi:hypothetical protein